MSLLVVGSVAYDSVNTGAGRRDDALGGSATYFSISSSYFTRVSLVAVVGDDFAPDDIAMLDSHEVDMAGLERRDGKTFRWSGVYDTDDVNTRRTLDTQLNVFANFTPVLNAHHRRQPYVFLANIDPDLQLSVLGQLEGKPKLVALDTMNFWIERKLNSLLRVIKEIDVLFIDENEIRDLASESNIVKATQSIMNIGPSVVVVKRGEHGAMLFHCNSIFTAPAYPLEEIVDPTGAGDSFAGGFLGYLAASGDLSRDAFRRATVLGSVMGSFAVESFSLERTSSLTSGEIEERFRSFASLSLFSPLGDGETLPMRCGPRGRKRRGI